MLNTKVMKKEGERGGGVGSNCSTDHKSGIYSSIETQRLEIKHLKEPLLFQNAKANQAKPTRGKHQQHIGELKEER